jgi:HSP20 family protein
MSLGTPIPRSPVFGAHPKRDVDRLFDELWSGFGLRPVPGVGGEARGFVPRLDVVETDEEYQVSAELPGLEEKDFELLFEDGVLTLKGEKRSVREGEAQGLRRAERAYGCFERSVRFGEEIDADGVKAAYRNGVLTVTVPKSPSAQPRTIPVQAV